MSKNPKRQRFNFLLLLIPLALLILFLGFIYKGSYLSCVTKDFSLCVNSRMYISTEGTFSFRYPNDYPISYKTGSKMVSQYNFNNSYVELVNFSSEFYPNAGGDRLGSVIVTKNSSYKTVEDYENKALSDFNNLPERYKGTPPKIEYVIIGGQNAVRITTEQQHSSFDPPSDEYILFHNGVMYQISFDYNNYYHKLPVTHYQKGKELILSTFTFVH